MSFDEVGDLDDEYGDDGVHDDDDDDDDDDYNDDVLFLDHGLPRRQKMK